MNSIFFTATQGLCHPHRDSALSSVPSPIGVVFRAGLEGSPHTLFSIHGVRVLPCPFSGVQPDFRFDGPSGYLLTDRFHFGADFGNEGEAYAQFDTLDELVAAWNTRKETK